MVVGFAFASNALFNFLVGLFVAKFLGPAEFGRFAIASATAIIINTGGFDWIRLSAVRFYSARTRGERSARARHARRLFCRGCHDRQPRRRRLERVRPEAGAFAGPAASWRARPRRQRALTIIAPRWRAPVSTMAPMRARIDRQEYSGTGADRRRRLVVRLRADRLGRHLPQRRRIAAAVRGARCGTRAPRCANGAARAGASNTCAMACRWSAPRSCSSSFRSPIA